MTTEITTDLIMEIARELRGTCDSLDDKLEERGIDFTDVPLELLQRLDNEVMSCDACGWWCDSAELDEDNVCEDCRD